MNQNTVKTQELKACCYGKVEQGLGHPKIYITFQKGSKIAVCPYCSLIYEYTKTKEKNT